MKRSDALAPLSRDHHHGLMVAQRLRRATKDSATEARAEFLAFWDAAGRKHFHVEEDVLLPAFAGYGSAEHEAVVRVLVEHVELRRRASDLRAASTPTLEHLHELGERLHFHIRHEERVLFPLIEQALPEDELRELGAAVERAEAAS